jgi:hypothetical protein
MHEEGRSGEFAETLNSYQGNFLNNPENAHNLRAFTEAVSREFTTSQSGGSPTGLTGTAVIADP